MSIAAETTAAERPPRASSRNTVKGGESARPVLRTHESDDGTYAQHRPDLPDGLVHARADGESMRRQVVGRGPREGGKNEPGPDAAEEQRGKLPERYRGLWLVTRYR